MIWSVERRLCVETATNTVIGFDIAVNDDQNGGTRDGASVCFGDANNFTSTACRCVRHDVTAPRAGA